MRLRVIKNYKLITYSFQQINARVYVKGRKKSPNGDIFLKQTVLMNDF